MTLTELKVNTLSKKVDEMAKTLTKEITKSTDESKKSKEKIKVLEYLQKIAN